MTKEARTKSDVTPATTIRSVLASFPPSLQKRVSKARVAKLATDSFADFSPTNARHLAEVALQTEALQALLKHYGISNGDDPWFDLAQCLARDFVPGMKVSKSGRPTSDSEEDKDAEGWVATLTRAYLKGENLARAAEGFAKRSGASNMKKAGRTILRRWQRLVRSGGIASAFGSKTTNYRWQRKRSAKSSRPRKL